MFLVLSLGILPVSTKSVAGLKSLKKFRFSSKFLSMIENSLFKEIIHKMVISLIRDNMTQATGFYCFENLRHLMPLALQVGFIVNQQVVGF